jgi:hypothetical protein
MTKERFIELIEEQEWIKDEDRLVYRKTIQGINFICYYIGDFMEVLRPAYEGRTGNLYNIKTEQHFNKFIKYLELPYEDWYRKEEDKRIIEENKRIQKEKQKEREEGRKMSLYLNMKK